MSTFGKFLVLIPLWLAGSVYAEPQAPKAASGEDVIYDLSLEDLLSIRVTTSSKYSEALNQSPGIISIVTQKEIESYGAQNLLQVLDRVTSVYSTGVLTQNDSMVSIRGDATTQTNNHVLVLLDGRPIRDSVMSGVNGDIYKSFPLAAIRQIEVVRGPGSVLYGTNAYMGVINLISKDASNQPVQADVSYGSFNAMRASVSGGAVWEDLKVSAAAYFHNDTGWDYTATDFNPITQQSATQTMKAYSRGLGASLNAKYKGWRLTSYFDEDELPFLSITSAYPSWNFRGDNHTDRAMVDLGRDFQITEGWKTTLDLTYNHLHTEDNWSPSNLSTKSNDLALEWSNNLHLLDSWDFIFGAVYELQTGATVDRTSSFWSVPPFTVATSSVYAQTTVRPLTSLSLFAGGQVNKSPGSDVHLVPRLGAIYTLSDAWSFKILYSEAFRSPSQNERKLKFLAVDGTLYEIGNPSLLPEIVSTLDVQLLYQKEHSMAALTFFRSEQNRIISRSFITFTNGASERSSGLELEGKFLASSRLSFSGSATYQRGDTGGVDDHSPNVMVKLGAAYASEGGLGLGVFDSYFSSIAPVRSTRAGAPTLLLNPETKAFHNLSVNLTADVTKLFDWKSLPKTELQLYFSNLLDTVIYAPEYTSGVINSVPSRPGRQYSLTVRMSF